MTDEAIYGCFSLDNFPDCFKEYADLLNWYKYGGKILDTSNASTLANPEIVEEIQKMEDFTCH